MKSSASEPGPSLFINFSFDRFPFLYTDGETKSLLLNPILKFMAYLLEL